MANLKVFTMDGCSHCDVLKERLRKESVEHDEININTTEGHILATKFHLRAYPTVMVVIDNIIVHAQEGFDMRANIKDWLEQFKKRG